MQSEDMFRHVVARIEARHPTLSANLVQFGSLLRAAGIGATVDQLRTAAEGLLTIDISRRNDVRAVFRSSLISRHADFPLFAVLFDQYWRIESSSEPPAPPRPTRLSPGDEQLGLIEQVDSAYARGEAQSAGDTPPRTYSAENSLLQKDFSSYRDDEVREARRYLRRLVPKLASVTSRRLRAGSTRGAIDLRRSLRQAARRGGDVLRLERRRRKVRRVNVVLLCDVSGSMDHYSRFLVQFLYALQHELRSVHTYVFSTQLRDITPMLRARSFDDALARVTSHVQGWSGGTLIGACIGDFNRRYARQQLGPRTISVIMSDGWDRGDITLLEREVRALQRRSYRLLWLNPLLGASSYAPLARGMAAALPSIDEFLPLHNLESLARMGQRLMRHARR